MSSISQTSGLCRKHSTEEAPRARHNRCAVRLEVTPTGYKRKGAGARKLQPPALRVDSRAPAFARASASAQGYGGHDGGQAESRAPSPEPRLNQTLEPHPCRQQERAAAGESGAPHRVVGVGRRLTEPRPANEPGRQTVRIERAVRVGRHRGVPLDDLLIVRQVQDFQLRLESTDEGCVFAPHSASCGDARDDFFQPWSEAQVVRVGSAKRMVQRLGLRRDESRFRRACSTAGRMATAMRRYPSAVGWS